MFTRKKDDSIDNLREIVDSLEEQFLVLQKLITLANAIQ
jgi:hypothetical protein